MSEVVTQMQAAIDLRTAVAAHAANPSPRNRRRMELARQVARKEGVDADRVERDAKEST